MVIENNALIVGLTGSFGSGCSTLRDALGGKGYKTVSLSRIVREKWEEQNEGGKVENATRSELQDVGNLLRKESGNNAFLVDKSLEPIISSKEKISKMVIDSIRHPDEIAALRGKYHNYLTVAIGCSVTRRWERMKKNYEDKGLTEINFNKDDKRDASEDVEYGQKVQLCVDSADISISNEQNFPRPPKQKEEILNTAEQYIYLISEGKDLRPPTFNESMMAIAYTKALSSSCYKRQVGAVITDENGDVLGIGCNENPSPLKACYNVYGECYKDICKKDIFDNIIMSSACPNPDCRKIISKDASIEFKCTKCGCNLAEFYLQDRLISRCTALHAEEAAIINVGGKNLKGCTIFTTTFPCFSCSQKIIASGITKVLFCEVYPDPDAASLFKIIAEDYGYDIKILNFEGVKARAYFRLFGNWSREKEKEIK